MKLPASLEDWLPFRGVDERKEQAKLALLCFPCAGAGASTYCSWSASLTDAVDLWSLQLPGRESRTGEAAFTDAAELVEHLGPLLAPHLRQPFVLLGHSLGARIAFEMCRWLRAGGWPEPNLLVAVAANAPSYDGHRDIHHLPDEEFLQNVRAFEGLSPAVLQRPQLLHMVLPALRADFRMFETYRYRREEPLACPILVCAGDADLYVTPEGLQGWAAETTSEFHTLTFRGGHFFMQLHRDGFIREILPWLTRSADRERPTRARAAAEES